MHLYLHVPFCARRCSYCDFAIAVRREVPSATYAEAVLKEWETWQPHEIWAGSPEVETIYFGGGTPSLLDPDQLERVMDGIRAGRPVAVDAEVTLEVNPDDVRPERAARWRSLGVNRLSMGAQSFDPAVLQWMHRTHTVEDIAAAVQTVRDQGFTNFSLDLIFAIPTHLKRDWTRDLDRALSLDPTHLSLYGLTVEPHTPLARWVARGETRRTDDESYAVEFLEADRALVAAGYEHYEVSNASRPGFRSRHNSAYWKRRPFIGLGPSAHSGWDRERRWNIREWAAYASAVAQGKSAREAGETLSEEAVALETLYLGLRTTDGVSAHLLPDDTRDRWIGEGWATRAGDRIVLTVEGWLRLDALVASAGPVLGSERGAQDLAGPGAD